jgi:excisionase family DNA binding protein
MFEKYKDVLNTHDLEEILGFGRNKVLKLLSEGSVKGRKIGRKWMILKDDVIEYLRNTDDLHRK